ncbi:MAG: efflux RND transporter periplasmic adaptor subunit [Polyangia bacterium]
MKPMQLARVVLRATTAVLLFACGACDRSGELAHAAAAPASAPREAVEVVRVVSKPLDTVIHLEGDLSAYESVAIFARVNAFVSTVAVDRGSVVSKGDRLATLVAPELTAQRTESEATARASQSNSARLKEAAKTPGTVAGNELESAAAVAAANEAKVDSLRALERYLTVTAPFDAVVTERNVHPGALVGPQSSTPMLRLEEQKRLRLTVAVPEPLSGLVADGATVRFTVRSRPGETFEATIRRSANSIDPRTRTMAVELDVGNARRTLAPGMFAEITWPVRRATPSLFVPSSSVVVAAERTFVVRVTGDTLTQVPVKRGARMGERVEIFGELSPNDLVLRHPSDEDRTGIRVAAVRESP